MCAKAAAEVGLWEIWLLNKTVVDKTKTDAVRFGHKTKDREKIDSRVLMSRETHDWFLFLGLGLNFNHDRRIAE